MTFYTRVVDLTHTLTPTFPTFEGWRAIQVKPVSRLDMDGYNINHWSLEEHVGTHLDAPSHMSPHRAADEIRAEELVGTLAVVDIRERAAQNADTLLTAEDLQGWERTYGTLPEGGVVALYSGWDLYVNSLRYRNADTRGLMHFPSFDVSAVEYLIHHSSVKGIIVDTLSIDIGTTHDYPVHRAWLGADRWAVECAANLGEVPPVGATVVVGAAKIQGATGGPCRVVALVP